MPLITEDGTKGICLLGSLYQSTISQLLLQEFFLLIYKKYSSIKCTVSYSCHPSQDGSYIANNQLQLTSIAATFYISSGYPVFHCFNFYLFLKESGQLGFSLKFHIAAMLYISSGYPVFHCFNFRVSLKNSGQLGFNLNFNMLCHIQKIRKSKHKKSSVLNHLKFQMPEE